MKKIILFLLIFLSFNVYAETQKDYKLITYTVDINGKYYTASVKYWQNCKRNSEGECTNDSKYELELDSLILTSNDKSDNNEEIRYAFNYVDGQYTIQGVGQFCSSHPNIKYGCGMKMDLTEEEINNPEILNKYLPKFMMFDSNKILDGSSTKIVTYISDDNYSSEDEKEFYNEFQKYVLKQQTNENEFPIYSSNIKELNGNSNITYDKNEDVVLRDLPSGEYFKIASEIYALLEKAKNIKVCTEDDLNAIRSQRHIPFDKLREDFDASLSSDCYSVLFKEKGLYDYIKQGKAFGNSKGAIVGQDTNNYKMEYLFFESFYLQGYGFLNGDFMQVEIKNPPKCSAFGDETYKFLQQIFNALKFCGIILGTLLGIVDIFKIITGKEDVSKKQFKTLQKRIIAIILLILTPILIEIIFKMINTIGINDPICGIR